MKFEKGSKKIGFPEHFKFGIEIEVNNTDTDKLYNSKESKEALNEIGWSPDTKEVLAHNGGAECVSGILNDSEQTWKNLEKVCQHIKKYPGKNGKEVVADEKCGCHVHFDATELLENPKMMGNFMKLWVDSEELIYKMCNAENNPIRKDAINQDLIPSINIGEPSLKNILSFKTIKQLAGLPYQFYSNAEHIFIERRKGFASPTSKKILDKIENDKLKVSYKKYGVLRDIALVKMKMDTRRYQGLNLANLRSRGSKRTIEFRMANGSIDPDIIKQNVFLYGSLLNTAREMTLNPEYKKEEISKFQETDCTEEEKVNAMLNVLFDNESDKNIYKNRWSSVKDAPVYAKNAKKGFATRFKRNDIKQVAENTTLSKLQDAMSYIKLALKSKEKDRDVGVEYDK